MGKGREGKRMGRKVRKDEGRRSNKVANSLRKVQYVLSDETEKNKRTHGRTDIKINLSMSIGKDAGKGRKDKKGKGAKGREGCIKVGKETSGGG